MDKDSIYRSVNDVRNDILDFFQASVGGRVQGSILPIGQLTPEGKSFLESMSGIVMKEHVDFVLNSDNLRHIYDNHYGFNEKDAGNNVPLNDDDIRNVVDVLIHPDSILYGIDKRTGLKMFFFLSKNDIGTYNLAEVCSTKKGNLTAKSYYHSKKGASQRVMEISRSLLPTSVTYSGATLSSAAKIPNLFETYKYSDEKISLMRNFRVKDFALQYGLEESDVRDYVTSFRESDVLSLISSLDRMKGSISSQYPRFDSDVLEELFVPIREELFLKFGHPQKISFDSAVGAVIERTKDSGARSFTSDQVARLEFAASCASSYFHVSNDCSFRSSFFSRILDSAYEKMPGVNSRWYSDAFDDVHKLVRFELAVNDSNKRSLIL